MTYDDEFTNANDVSLRAWTVFARTFARLFLCGLAAAVAQTGHGLDVALTDRWRMENQLGRTRQTYRKSSSTHQNACNT